MKSEERSNKIKNIIIAVLAVLIVIGTAACVFLLVGNSGRKLKKQLAVADACMEDKDYKKAAEEYKKAIEMDDTSVDAYMGIAEAYTELAEEADDTEDAVDYYEKAIKYLKKGYKVTNDDDFNDEIKKIEKKINRYYKEKETAPAAEAPAVEEAAPAVEEAAPAEEAPVVDENDLGWVDKYIEYISENREYFLNYTIIHVNEDIIPELVCSTGFEAGGNEILTYYNGEIDVLQTSRLNYEYEEYKNVLNNSDGHMGAYYDYLYEIKNGKWSELAIGAFGDEPVYDGNGDIVDYAYSDYSWNGVDVSEAEYYNNLDKYYNRDNAYSYYNYNEGWYNADQMITMLSQNK